MADIHIDEFYQDCGKTLALLFNCFPRLTTVYVDDLIKSSGKDEYGIPSRRHKACFDTLLWLSAEGYIRYQDNIRQDALDQVVLTEKSFLRLSLPTISSETDASLPRNIAQKRATLAWQLRTFVGSGSTDNINQVVMDFLNG